MAAPNRNVRWSSRFTRQAEELGIEAQRLDDALDGATWAASKDPERSSRAVPGTTYRMIPTDAFPDVPALRIYLEVVDDDQVEFDALEKTEEDEDDPGL